MLEGNFDSHKIEWQRWWFMFCGIKFKPNNKNFFGQITHIPSKYFKLLSRICSLILYLLLATLKKYLITLNWSTLSNITQSQQLRPYFQPITYNFLPFLFNRILKGKYSLLINSNKEHAICKLIITFFKEKRY